MVTLQEAVKDYHAKQARAVTLQLAWMDAGVTLGRMRTPYAQAVAKSEERRLHEEMTQARTAAREAWLLKESLKARIARAS